MCVLRSQSFSNVCVTESIIQYRVCYGVSHSVTCVLRSQSFSNVCVTEQSRAMAANNQVKTMKQELAQEKQKYAQLEKHSHERITSQVTGPSFLCSEYNHMQFLDFIALNLAYQNVLPDKKCAENAV